MSPRNGGKLAPSRAADELRLVARGRRARHLDGQQRRAGSGVQSGSGCGWAVVAGGSVSGGSVSHGLDLRGSSTEVPASAGALTSRSTRLPGATIRKGSGCLVVRPANCTPSCAICFHVKAAANWRRRPRVRTDEEHAAARRRVDDAPELHLAGPHGELRLEAAVDRERPGVAPPPNRLGLTPNWLITSTGCDASTTADRSSPRRRTCSGRRRSRLR